MRIKFGQFILISVFTGFSCLGFASKKANAQPNEGVEASCRIKAKAIATETYRSCVTENKTAQIQKLKKSYQDRIQKLKAEYEGEIERISGKKVSAKTNNRIERIENEMESDDSMMDIPEPIPVEQ